MNFIRESKMLCNADVSLAYPTLSRLRESAENSVWQQKHVWTVTVVRWHHWYTQKFWRHQSLK